MNRWETQFPTLTSLLLFWPRRKKKACRTKKSWGWKEFVKKARLIPTSDTGSLNKEPNTIRERVVINTPLISNLWQLLHQCLAFCLAPVITGWALVEHLYKFPNKYDSFFIPLFTVHNRIWLTFFTELPAPQTFTSETHPTDSTQSHCGSSSAFA